MDTSMEMAPVLEVINRRSSVRSYSGEAIDRPTVEALLQAAVRAPTAMHEEPWQFLVIQDRATLRQLSERAKALFSDEARRLHTPRGDSAAARFSQPEFDVFYDAGTLIVICSRMSGPFVAADCWLAAENLILAAQAMGLGTCVIGSAVSALNTEAVKADLGIPGQTTAVAPVIVGKPRGDWPPTQRRLPEVLRWR